MTTAVVTVAPNERVDAAHHLMQHHDIRHLPVTEGDRLVGIIAASDVRLAEATSRGGGPIMVEDAMTTNVITVAPQTTVEGAAMLMVDNKVGALPVVDADGAVIGILTAADVLNVFLDVMGVGSGAKRVEIALPDRPGALATAVRIIGDLHVTIVSLLSSHAGPGTRVLIFRLNCDDIEPVLTALADAEVEVLSTGEGDD